MDWKLVKHIAKSSGPRLNPNRSSDRTLALHHAIQIGKIGPGAWVVGGKTGPSPRPVHVPAGLLGVMRTEEATEAAPGRGAPTKDTERTKKTSIDGKVGRGMILRACAVAVEMMSGVRIAYQSEEVNAFNHHGVNLRGELASAMSTTATSGLFPIRDLRWRPSCSKFDHYNGHSRKWRGSWQSSLIPSPITTELHVGLGMYLPVGEQDDERLRRLMPADSIVRRVRCCRSHISRCTAEFRYGEKACLG